MSQSADEFPVERLCNTLNISRSAYYAYQAGHTHQLSAKQLELQQMATTLFYEHERRYGSRRLLLDLQEQGYEVGRHQLRKIMKDSHLQAIQPRSFVPHTTDSRHAGPFSPNLLLDRPLPIRPGEVLVGDITYLPLPNGEWGYLAGWMDLFSRKISGWRVDEHMEEELVHSALQQSIGHNQLGKAGRPVPKHYPF